MEAEKIETISYTFININPFPEWTGAVTVDGPRSKVNSFGNYKPEFALPIPSNDEDAQKYYGMTLAALIGKGVVQNHYDVDGEVKKWYAALLTEENDVPDCAAPPAALWIKVRKERAASEVKKTKATMAQHGITSADDLAAQLAELKALKAQMTGKKSKK